MNRPVTGRRLTVEPKNVRYVTLEELRPGDVVAEGIVVARSMFERTYDTASGTFQVPAEADLIAVLCRISDDMLKVTQHALAQRAAAHMTRNLGGDS